MLNYLLSKAMYLDDINEPDEAILQELEMMKRMDLPTSFLKSPCDMISDKEVCIVHCMKYFCM